MKLILCGGDIGEKVLPINKRFIEEIDRSLPVLLVPFAVTENEYADCLHRVKNEMAIHGFEKVVLPDNPENISLDGYSGLYISGGNTYRLLQLIREYGLYEKIKRFVESGKPVMGSSAGAVIFGKDINSVCYMDENEDGVTDTSGFDMLNDYSICPHFTDSSDEDNAKEYTAIFGLIKKGMKVYGVPGQAAIFIDGEKMSVIGSREIYDLNGIKE